MRATRHSWQTSQHIGRVLLVALLVLTFILPSSAGAAPLSVGKKLALTRDKMASTNMVIAKAATARKRVGVQMEVAQENLNQANEHYRQAEAKLAQIDAELTWTKKRLRWHESLLDRRVVGIYRRGLGDVVAWVVQSTDYNDLITRLHMLTVVANQDASIVRQVRTIRDRFDRLQIDQKAQTQIKAAELGKAKAARADRERLYAKYQTLIKQLKTYYAKLTKQEGKLSVAYAAELARQRAAALGNSPGWIPPPGWVPPPGGRPEAVKLALKELGKPYVWGATGPDSFDCSGLMVYVYNQLGINLPRVSREQYWVGAHQTRATLKPGDLVFFSYDGSPGGIHHVGMYIGSGKFIEAPNSGDVVKISDLDSRGSFIGGTRI